MNKLLFSSIILSFLFSCETNKESEKPDQAITDMGYDSLMASRYGADKLGMKKYVMAFLKSGPNRDQDSATAASIQQGHMNNIQRMAREGKLVLAGPFFGQGELRGIYIFNVSTIDEAEELTKTDPAIQAGRLEMELKEWYGSAALMAVNDMHEKLIAPDN